MASDIVRGINFSNSFNIGTDIPNKITPNVDGTTIVRDPTTGVLSSPAAAGGVVVVVGFISMLGDGTVVSAAGGATGTRAAVGRYNLVPPATAQFLGGLVVAEPENIRDAIHIHPTDLTGTRIHISEQDNGGTAGIYRDRSFTAVWYGPGA